MKTETLLLIGAAIGVGFLIAKKRGATAAAKIPGTAPRIAARAIPEENAEIVFVQPDVEYVPVWGSPWGSYGGGWGRRGGGGHHGGGHHGGHHHGGHH